MATTSISVTDAENIVKRLRDLIPPEKVKYFWEKKPQGLEAGPPRMDAAKWLEMTVGDRANAAAAHIDYLVVVFEGLAKAVETMATTLTGVDEGNGYTLGALKSWIDTVIGAKSTPLPPGIPSNFSSNDTGGDPQLVWEIDDGGYHTGDPDSIKIDLPDASKLPNPGLIQEYQDIYHTIEDRASFDVPIPTGIFTPDGQEVKKTDPEA
jgi:hypothetical protein